MLDGGSANHTELRDIPLSWCHFNWPKSVPAEEADRHDQVPKDPVEDGERESERQHCDSPNQQLPFFYFL
jgi:hypothetical protein